jgi:UDP-N-acetylglucosamine 2-epimerase (non-hydrolysing)
VETIKDNCMIVVGTRPEIIKMAPVIRALDEAGQSYVFVHCGQHYDFNMSQTFIDELELPKPDYGFAVRADLPGVQTAKILTRIEGVVQQVKPGVVLVEGDTNGVLASGLAAVKLGVPVGHVEAGLRSFDRRMPEEHNRRLVDHLSTYLFAPTERAREHLEKESVWGQIHVTGNTVIDAVMQHLPMAERKSSILDTIRFGRFALATAHRCENVDNPEVLADFVAAFVEAPIPVVYPVHPRAEKRLRQQKLWGTLNSAENVQLLEPLGYFDFLLLMKHCDMLITDSGGLQEEATAPLIRKPVLVIRLSTERPEAVDAGFVRVVGVKKQGIVAAMEVAVGGTRELPQLSPYGNGDAAKKIVDILLQAVGA